MINSAPSSQKKLLQSLLDRSIVSVSRQLFQDDIDLIDWEQNADGVTEITLDNQSKIYFVAITEIDSVGVGTGSMPKYGDSYLEKVVSQNSFWKERINQTITQVSILRGRDASLDHPNEFAISIKFSNGKEVLFEYVNLSDIPDTLKVSMQPHTDNYVVEVCH